MEKLCNEIMDKDVRLVFLSSSYRYGGAAAADYKVIGYVDGFIKLRDYQGQTVYYNAAQINVITVLPSGDFAEKKPGR